MDAYPTGSTAFDDLLGGGYEKGIITTIYGPSGSGKSNLCLLTLANIEQRAIFIDTEGSFSVDRIMQLNPKFKDLLERVILLRALNLEEQTNIINKLPDMIRKDIEIIIIDGIATQYRAAIADNFKEANNHLSKQINTLFSIASKNNIPIIITSQVYADLETEDGVKVVGGDIIKYNSKTMIELTNKKETRTATIIKHRFLAPNKKTNFKIENVGIYEK